MKNFEKVYIAKLKSLVIAPVLLLRSMTDPYN